MIALAAITAVASGQPVMSNAALLLALCTAGAAVAVARRRWLVAGGIMGCGAVAALSLLPYAAQPAAARQQWGLILPPPTGGPGILRPFPPPAPPPPLP